MAFEFIIRRPTTIRSRIAFAAVVKRNSIPEPSRSTVPMVAVTKPSSVAVATIRVTPEGRKRPSAIFVALRSNIMLPRRKGCTVVRVSKRRAGGTDPISREKIILAGQAADVN